MENFTPWTMFVDLGVISCLLLVCKFLRVKLRLMQKFFIPPSLAAGFLGLALGPGGFDVLPLSSNMGTYASILIAFIFGSLALTSQRSEEQGASIGRMWAYSQAGLLLQWAVGGLLGLLLLVYIWPGIGAGFGITMPSGFCGGHGTAAAVGEAFRKLGNDDILTLAMTAATVGIVASVFIGLPLIKWATKKGQTAYLTDYDELPVELRTGLLVPEEKRPRLGTDTCSSISIDSLTFNLIVVSVIALGGYGLSKLVGIWVPGLELPVFSCAFVVGVILRKIFDHTGAMQYTCPQTISHMSGMMTDFLVVFGIASIKLSVVVAYWQPLVVLLLVGLAFTLAYVLIVGRLMQKECWFEKAIFTWGWFTGTMAMGIALLRVVDPDMRSRCLDSYALAYLFIAPVEIALVTFAPMVFTNGWGLWFTGVCLIGALGVLAFAKLKGWMSDKC
ncbi:MAG: sodium:glutamate symporter [Akkermansiaceae bacterium]|nr:sodium:glutamate symporter [Akkermansiaceae bacterium]